MVDKVVGVLSVDLLSVGVVVGVCVCGCVVVVAGQLKGTLKRDVERVT